MTTIDPTVAPVSPLAAPGTPESQDAEWREAAPAAALDCPVCPRTGLPPGTRYCPNCTVDLQPLWNLRELPFRYRQEALEAARRGDLERALSKLLLAAELSSGDDRELWVLLGNVCWQRGERARAERYWKQGLARDPRNEACRALLLRARRGRAVRAAVGSSLGLVLAAALAWSGWEARARRDRPAIEEPVFARALARNGSSRFVALAARGGDPYRSRGRTLPAVSSPRGEDAPAAPAPRLDAAFERLARRLAGEPGVGAELARGDTARSAGASRELRITFVEGLFSPSSDELTASGRKILLRVATILDAAQRPLLVTVAGASDDQQPAPGGRWRDNEQLQQARSRGAIRAMLEVLGPRGSAALRPAVLGRAPFPNDSASSRARNRSVVIRVWAPEPGDAAGSGSSTGAL